MVTPPTGIVATVEKDFALVFTKSHIIMAVIILACLLGLAWFWKDHAAASADLAAAVADQKAVAADTLNKQLQQQNTVTQQQTQAQIAALTIQNQSLQAQIAALVNAISTRNTVLVTQQKTDATLPPTDLSTRWQSLVHMPTGVVPSTSGFSVSPPAAVATVQELESIDTITADNTDLKQQVVDLDGVIGHDGTIMSASTDALISEKKAHASDQATCTTDLAAKDATIKQVKADAAKGKAKWFIIGGIIGEIFHVAISHTL